MSRIRNYLSIFLLCIVFSGTTACYTTKIYVSSRNVSPATTTTSYAWSFLWGLYTPNIVDAYRQCDGHVLEVRTRTNLFSMVVSWVTAGIVNPLAVKVTCGAS